MPYCDKCGSKNEEDAEYCSKCGAPFKDGDERRRYRHDRHRQREECFGLPHGGLIVGVIVGVFLIIFGLSSIYGFSVWQYIWPIVIVIIGILIIGGAIYSYKNRY